MAAFDYTGLSDSQKSQLIGKSRPEVECLMQSWEKQLRNPIIGKFCEVIWDGIYCWPAAMPNTTVNIPCSKFFGEKFFTEKSTITAFKVCSHEGMWVRGGFTNYSRCIESMRDLVSEFSRDNEMSSVNLTLIPSFLLGGSILSILFLLCTICVYVYLKSTYLDRLKILMQLMIAMFIKSIIWIIIVGPEAFPNIIDYRKWGWTCKLLISALVYAQQVSMFWVLVLGHYLNEKLNSMELRIEYSKAQYMAFCWVIPGLIVFLWVTVMASYDQSYCWTNFSKTPVFWIITIPMLVAFAAEVFYLVNIIRTIFRRYQCVHNESERVRLRKAKQEVGILSILVAINTVLLLCNPWGEANQHYRLFQAFFQSMQGGFVAVLCCMAYYRVLLRKLNRLDARRQEQTFLERFQ